LAAVFWIPAFSGLFGLLGERMPRFANNPEEFRVRQKIAIRKGSRQTEWVAMRKGVAWLFRYRASLMANSRYLDALAVVDDPTNTWRRSLMIHIVACIFFPIAYQGLSVFAYPAPYFLSTGNMVGITGTSEGMPFGLPGVGGTVGIASALHGVPHDPPPFTVLGEPSGPPFRASSNAEVVEPGNTVGVDVGSLPPSGDSNTVFVTRAGETSSFVPQTDGVTTEFHVGFWTRGSVSKWTPFCTWPC
jgi:hypothetical protein